MENEGLSFNDTSIRRQRYHKFIFDFVLEPGCEYATFPIIYSTDSFQINGFANLLFTFILSLFINYLFISFYEIFIS